MTLEKKLLAIHNQYEEDVDFKDIHPKNPDLSDYIKMEGLTVPDLIKHLISTKICSDEQTAHDFVDQYYPMTEKTIVEYYQNMLDMLSKDYEIIHLKLDIWLDHWERHLEICYDDTT